MQDKSLEEQQNNPLHGVGLEQVITELVDHYGWDILDTAMRFNCFHMNPSIASSVKYLKKTEWAREKLERFYLSRYKRMPKPTPEEMETPARQRTFAVGVTPREPMVLTVDSILDSQAKAASTYKAKKAQNRKPRR
ncbi:hypothetical protein ST37_14350 [Vibrio sp. qd031]|uniref:VF530 family DNA-binding protein n=1 Tax=Vibrio ulleungensis TaxID=2807619 RepID=A0ABS2HEQ3_9VIBR|nr:MULTISPECIES: VF530 family DNA-binding protein [Vibrio]MBM7036058.1 VF530 family DNA-binding protein [Vibrio ulleungensis]ORT49564.1 hypothetical protein ST37_14350 [Vibrio sp. qd031]